MGCRCRGGCRVPGCRRGWRAAPAAGRPHPMGPSAWERSREPAQPDPVAPTPRPGSRPRARGDRGPGPREMGGGILGGVSGLGSAHAAQTLQRRVRAGQHRPSARAAGPCARTRVCARAPWGGTHTHTRVDPPQKGSHTRGGPTHTAHARAHTHTPGGPQARRPVMGSLRPRAPARATPHSRHEAPDPPPPPGCESRRGGVSTPWGDVTHTPPRPPARSHGSSASGETEARRGGWAEH